MKCPLPLPAWHGPRTHLLPLAEGGELLGGDQDTEFEDGLQLRGKPLGLEVLELGLSLPDERYIQAQAEHADGESRGSAATRAVLAAWRMENAAGRQTSARYAGAQLSLAARAPPFDLIDKRPAHSKSCQQPISTEPWIAQEAA